MKPIKYLNNSTIVKKKKNREKLKQNYFLFETFKSF